MRSFCESTPLDSNENELKLQTTLAECIARIIQQQIITRDLGREGEGSRLKIASN